jgi:hypothetical protein
VPLPGVDDEGRRVLIGRFGKSDPALYKIEDMFKVSFFFCRPDSGKTLHLINTSRHTHLT